MFVTIAITPPPPRGPSLAVALAVCVLALAPGRAGARTATIAVAPAAPADRPGVTFTATATADAGQAITDYAWTVDGAAGPSGATTTSITRTFTTPGSHTVTVTVTESTASVPTVDTTSGPISQTVTVNTLPTVRFSWTPLHPIPGAGVTFTSQSFDTGGTIVNYSWDLNGDGVFGDFSGPTATTATTTILANQSVGLRVTDDLGACRPAGRTSSVDQPPVAWIHRRSGEPARRTDGHVHVELDGQRRLDRVL